MTLKKLFAFGPICIVIAAMLWALDGVLRRSLYSLPPITIVFYEHLIGTIILIPVLFHYRQQIMALRRKELLMLGVIALCSGVLGTLWFTTALLKVNFISFSVVFLLQKVQPVFVLIAAAVVLKEKITLQYLRWAAVALIAAYFVTFPNGVVNFSTGSGTAIAAGYALLAAAAWGTSTVFSKIALQTRPWQMVTGLRFAITTVLALLFVIGMGQSSSLSQVGIDQVVRLVMIAGSTGMVALLIYYKGLAQTEAKIATILELVFPVMAVMIDAVVYHSYLLPTQYAAAAVLLYAAYRLSARAPKLVFRSTKVKGKGRGKVMGFPTINFQIPPQFVLEDGIYAAMVTIHGTRYQGALHYGPIPTYGERSKSLEVFLLDVSSMSEKKLQDEMTVEIVQYLRPVMKFSSTESLVRQIAIDVETVRGILQ